VSDAPRQGYGRIAKRGGLIGLLGFGSGQLVNLATYVALAHVISPAQLGVFAAGSLVSGVGLLFAESGMLAALVTRQTRFDQAANTAFLWNIISGGGLTLIALALAPLVGVVFRSQRAGDVAAVMSGILWLRALSVVPDAVLQRRLSFLRRIIIDPLAMVAFGVVALSTTSAGAGVWGLVMGSYALIAIRTIGMWAFAHWKPHPRAASRALWRELIAFSRSVLLSEAVRHFVASFDVLLIGRFSGPSALGQYRYGLRVAGQPGAAWVGAGAYVLLPVLARFADDGPRLRASCLKVFRLMGVLLFPLTLGISALGPTITTLVFGREWRTAGWALMALAGVSIGESVVSVASEAFKVVGRPTELPKVHGLSALVIAGCMLALLPAGMIGVAGGLSIGSCVVAGYAIRRMQVVVGLPAHAVLRALVPPLLVAAGASGIGFLVETNVVHANLRGTAGGLLALSAELLGIWAIYAVALSTIEPEFRHFVVLGFRSLRGSRAVAARRAGRA
jgi:O-antigen/teichoic acid export membrane protein